MTEEERKRYLSEENILNMQINKVCDMALDKDACHEYCRQALITIQAINAQRSTIQRPVNTEYVMDTLRNLINACYKADAHEELSEFIDGSLITEAEKALTLLNSATGGEGCK